MDGLVVESIYAHICRFVVSVTSFDLMAYVKACMYIIFSRTISMSVTAC